MSFSDKLGDAIILTRPPFFINELIPLYICEKVGIVHDSSDNIVVFTGSPNESATE